MVFTRINASVKVKLGGIIMTEVENLLNQEKQLRQKLRQTQNSLIEATTFHLWELESLLNKLVPRVETGKMVRIDEFQDPDYIYYLCIVDSQTGEICAKYPLCCYYCNSKKQLESKILVTMECLLEGIEYNNIGPMLSQYLMDNKMNHDREGLFVGITKFEDRSYIYEFLRSVAHFRAMGVDVDYSNIIEEMLKESSGKQKVLQSSQPQD